ncbi:AraC family transcriptional regulator [bacterium D16-51]|nr:AraC family transcriptional regulator [bacterium D16-59]RKI62022.1 AraC family transcriptional regulator [bacterium D16-51]
MALQECGLNLDRVSKELQPHGSLQFPCAGYSSYHTDRQEDIIPWHWHEEIEIVYIENGQMEIKIPSKSFLLQKGDYIVINSNVLHYGAAVRECELHSLVFSPALIAGNEDFVFAKKYMQPLLDCNNFCGYFIKAGDNENVAHWFSHAFESLAKDCCGYEFIVRENLSRICLFLYGEFKPQADTQNVPLNQDNLRIRKMLAFIHKKFADDISVPEIASIADISERECLRCFQKIIQLSPIQYLLKYRVMQGAEMLLGNPADSVSEIATSCGFDSPSNFSKIFKRFYNCTPREYRKLNLK